jgi:uncharacterized protein YndB with AHSA1/START domain
MTSTDFTVSKEALEVVITHVFDAPRETVWKVYTDPSLIPEWWGPRGLTTVVDRMDAKAGGAWRYVQHDEEGNEHAFSGVYMEVKEPELISDTFNYEPLGPGHEVTEELSLEALPGGTTRATSTSHFRSTEDLEGMLESGMEQGAVESYDRLDELLEKIQAGGEE